MNFSNYKNVFTILFCILFALLFYDKLIAINILIYEVSLFGIAYFIHKPTFKTKLSKLILIGTSISLAMVIFHNSSISKFVNISSFILLIGVLTFSEYKLVKNYFLQVMHNIMEGVGGFINSFSPKKGKKRNVLYYLKIIILPLLIILVFLFIYYNSNSYFAELTDSFFSSIYNLFSWLPAINISFIVYLFMGLVISISVIYGIKNSYYFKKEIKLTEILIRKRNTKRFNNIIGLKNEYKSGIFLLVALNLLLLIFNYSDISKVWFSYEWNGGFLKEFVHSGTYLLIFSLLLSIGIVLYFFKGNLNFYFNNKFLKALTFIWLAQNLILVISLFVRNSIYINHFALAYKRIGVFAFLIAVCIGIYTIYRKVKHKKSFYYLIKINTFSIYIIFILLTCFNWDVLIAKHNVKSYESAFIEMEFLLELSDKALPYINISDEKLSTIEITQSNRFSFKKNYISNNNYQLYLNKKLHLFMDTYPKRSFLEWNYADSRAYKLLKK